jgi:hypothetical protein
VKPVSHAQVDDAEHVPWPLQSPQSSVPPQPSEIVPQTSPAGHDGIGVHPHTFAVPLPPQVCGAVQVPQGTVPPQPSGIVPQSSGEGQIVSGVQGGTWSSALEKEPKPTLDPPATRTSPPCRSVSVACMRAVAIDAAALQVPAVGS